MSLREPLGSSSSGASGSMKRILDELYLFLHPLVITVRSHTTILESKDLQESKSSASKNSKEEERKQLEHPNHPNSETGKRGMLILTARNLFQKLQFLVWMLTNHLENQLIQVEVWNEIMAVFLKDHLSSQTLKI